MSKHMAKISNVMFRYGYSEAEATTAIKAARALSATGLNDLDVAMEMLFRLDNPEQQKFDTRENGWRYI